MLGQRRRSPLSRSKGRKWPATLIIGHHKEQREILSPRRSHNAAINLVWHLCLPVTIQVRVEDYRSFCGRSTSKICALLSDLSHLMLEGLYSQIARSNLQLSVQSLSLADRFREMRSSVYESLLRVDRHLHPRRILRCHTDC